MESLNKKDIERFGNNQKMGFFFTSWIKARAQVTFSQSGAK